MAKKKEIMKYSQEAYDSYIKSKFYEDKNINFQASNLDNLTLYEKFANNNNPSIIMHEIINDINFENLKNKINLKCFFDNNKYHINQNFEKSLKNILKAFSYWCEIYKKNVQGFSLEITYSRPLMKICSKILVFMYSHYIFDGKICKFFFN